MNLNERDRVHVWHPYTQMLTQPPLLPIVRGEGVYLYTEDRRKILDGISSWWVNIHGHSHPKLNAALAAQAQEIEHVIFAGCTHRPAVELVARDAAVLEPGTVEKTVRSFPAKPGLAPQLLAGFLFQGGPLTLLLLRAASMPESEGSGGCAGTRLALLRRAAPRS